MPTMREFLDTAFPSWPEETRAGLSMLDKLLSEVEAEAQARQEAAS